MKVSTRITSLYRLSVHKRIFDLFVATILLLVVSPLTIVIAILIKLERHIFFYSDVLLPDDRTLTELKIISKEKGLKIVSIGKHFDWADINVVSPSPFRWMGYLKNVDFVFTCMYHGLLFSIKFNRQFAMFLIPERENKCLDFLERTGLETRIVQNPSQIRTLYYTIIDYSPVNIFMQDQKEISAAFLNEENLGRISIAKD